MSEMGVFSQDIANHSITPTGHPRTTGEDPLRGSSDNIK